MSRTDKDRPLRVKVHDTTLPLVERHMHHHHAAWRRGTAENPEHKGSPVWPPLIIEHACDLPDLSDRRISQHHTSLPDTCCDYGLPWWVEGYWWCSTPPKDYVAGKWTRPERRRERNLLREAAKEYNATGDLDGYDFPNYQHRRMARWLWD